MTFQSLRDNLLKPLLSVLPMAAFFAACVEPIDLDAGEEPQVVVSCILTENDVQTLEMYYTTTLMDGIRRPVENAEVTLKYDYAGARKFNYVGDGFWQCEYKPEYGKRYNLVIEFEGHVLQASTTFPSDVTVACYGRGYDASEGRHKKWYLMYSYELRLFNRSPECPPYYGYPCLLASHLWAFPKDKGWGDDYQKYIATSHLCADDFNLTSLRVSDLPCFSADSVKAMPKWLREELGWYPLMMGELQVHQGFVRIDIPKDYHSGQTQAELKDSPIYSDIAFVLVRPFPTSWSNYDGPYQERGGLYDIYILSDEADNYFKDVYRKHLNKDNFLFEYDTENIYSNISGGIGVFGAMIHRNNETGIRGYLNDFVPGDRK